MRVDHLDYYIGFLILWLTGVFCYISIDKAYELYFFLENRSPWLDTLMLYATTLSETWVYVLLGVVFLLIDWRKSILIGATGIASLIVSAGLKQIFSISRPKIWLSCRYKLEPFDTIAGNYIHDGFNSFPSGHTMSAFALATVCVYLFPKLRWLWLIIACLIGLSRIYLVQHFLPDVLFGSLIGVLLGFVLVESYRHIISKQPKKLA